MSNLQDGSTTGQVGTSTPSVNSTPPTAEPANDVGELLRVMEQSSKAFVRTVAVLTSFGERLDAIEKHLDITPNKERGADECAAPSDDDGAGPVTEERPTGPLGRLALRQDGGVLLEITSDVAEEDLTNREVARFVTLRQDEALDAVDRAEVGFNDAAARAGWQLARGRLGYPPKPSTEEPTS